MLVGQGTGVFVESNGDLVVGIGGGQVNQVMNGQGNSTQVATELQTPQEETKKYMQIEVILSLLFSQNLVYEHIATIATIVDGFDGTVAEASHKVILAGLIEDLGVHADFSLKNTNTIPSNTITCIPSG